MDLGLPDLTIMRKNIRSTRIALTKKDTKDKKNKE